MADSSTSTSFLGTLWANHKKKIIVGGIILAAVIVVFILGCNAGLGC